MAHDRTGGRDNRGFRDPGRRAARANRLFDVEDGRAVSECSDRDAVGAVDAQLQVGYRGLIELAYRSARIASISAKVVREGDAFDYLEGSEPYLRFRRSLDPERSQRPRIAAYSIAYFARGAPLFEILDPSEIEARRQASRSASSKSSPWHTHPDAMWKKSALRALAAWLPQSPEFQRAAIGDEQVDLGLRANIVDVVDGE